VNTIRAVRGMVDILPAVSDRWQQLERQLADLLATYGYGEIRLPLVESTDLFKRSIGEVTDIVEKEMYTFDDRSGGSLTLRPEGTAGCVRAAIQHGLLQTLPQRLWYLGPMFRYERPQMGRQRQFHQLGVEVLGASGADVEAELLLLSARCWHLLGLSDTMTLEINSLGDTQDRLRYRTDLQVFLRRHSDDLDPDSQRRLETNPLRVLDSKVESTQALVARAPALADYLSPEARSHFDTLCGLLDATGVPYRINPKLVRGLDYYNRTVFEWVTHALGAQGTVCAGGRYDGLPRQLGGPDTPAAGFAIGLERLMLLLQAAAAPVAPAPEIYAMALGAGTQAYLLPIVERLRETLPQVRIDWHLGEGSFRSLMKRADRSGARIALLVGTDELADSQVVVKPLRGEAQQLRVGSMELPQVLGSLLQEYRTND